MKKKSLLSVMGTHPDPGQVALEVSEDHTGRGGVNSEGVKGHVDCCSEVSQKTVTNHSTKWDWREARGYRYDVQSLPTNLESAGPSYASTTHGCRTF